jgi:negative regulator of flagellin synthesis FlgM
MRINPYIQVQQVYGNTKVNKSQKTGAPTRTDGLEISSFGRDIQTAKAAIANAPDVRSDAVAKAKADLENGTLTGESFADKLLAAFEAR